jgi:hypothetical protein
MFTRMLDKKRFRTLRSSLQTMYKTLDIESSGRNRETRASKNRIAKDHEAAQAQLALISRERLNLEDEVAEAYRFAKYRDALAKHFAKKHLALHGRDLLIWLLISWRANVRLIKSSRTHIAQDKQMDALESTIRSKYKANMESHADAGLNVVRRTVVRHELVTALFLWQLCRSIAKFERQYEVVKAKHDEIQQKVLKSSGVELTRAMEKQNIQLHATTMMKAFAEEGEMLRLVFNGWRNTTVGKATAMFAQLRKWAMMHYAGNKTSRWLVPTCYRFWKLCILLELWEVEHAACQEIVRADREQNEFHSHRLKSFCTLIDRNFELWLCFAALQYWRRQHDDLHVERIAEKVQLQWSESEQKCQTRLRSMASLCNRLAKFIPNQTRRFVVYKYGYFALKAWQRHCTMSKLERQLYMREDSSFTAVQAQQRFEEVAQTEWTDTCIYARFAVRGMLIQYRVMGAWRWQSRVSHSQCRINPRNLRRAAAVVSRKNELARTSRVNLAFAGWHGAACRARSRWLQKRCKRIRAVLGQSSARSTPRRNSKDFTNNAEALTGAAATLMLAASAQQGQVVQARPSLRRPSVLSSGSAGSQVSAATPANATSPLMASGSPASFKRNTLPTVLEANAPQSLQMPIGPDGRRTASPGNSYAAGATRSASMSVPSHSVGMGAASTGMDSAAFAAKLQGFSFGFGSQAKV